MQDRNKKAAYSVVRKHNHAGDAWVVIYGKIFDVTEWQHDHPGGDDILIRNAGKPSPELISIATEPYTHRNGRVRNIPQRRSFSRCECYTVM